MRLAYPIRFRRGKSPHLIQYSCRLPSKKQRLNQAPTKVAAAQQALRGVGKLVVRNYLERCALSAIKSGHEEEVFDELMNIVFKLTR